MLVPKFIDFGWNGGFYEIEKDLYYNSWDASYCINNFFYYIYLCFQGCGC